MGWRDVTREAVLAAIAEYDQPGQNEFLWKYGYDRARSVQVGYEGASAHTRCVTGAARPGH